MMRATSLSLILLSAPQALAAEDSHAGHDHSGTTKHEWAGLFKVDTASHTWKMQKVGGKVRRKAFHAVDFRTTQPRIDRWFAIFGSRSSPSTACTTTPMMADR